MAKTKFASYEEAVEARNAQKEALNDAKKALKAFLKENEIKDVEAIEDAKLSKKYNKFQTAVEEANAELDATNEEVKALRPKKENPAFAKKYEYPEGITTAEDKKKYRTKLRRDAKKAVEAESEESADKPVKESKKAKKVEEGVEEEAPTKKAKKAKKVEEDED
jgi:hypothetical protein